MSDEQGLVPPSQDVADQIVLDILNRINRVMGYNPLTLDQNWALAAISNKVMERDVEAVNLLENGLSHRIMRIAQYSFYLGRSYAKEYETGNWRNSGEMRSYD